jgi:hypothetical protein
MWQQSLWRQFLADEFGGVLSAEAVLIGTVGVIGAVAGMNVATKAVNDELKEFGLAIRSLDQSYAVQGHRSCGAYTAGSCFTQQPVEKSREELCAFDATQQQTATPPAAPAAPVTPAPIPAPEPQPAENQIPVQPNAI